MAQQVDRSRTSKAGATPRSRRGNALATTSGAVAAIEGFLNVGDFRSALPIATRDFVALALQKEIPDDLRIRALAVAAELSSYLGRDDEARELQSRYVARDAGRALLVRKGTSARAKHALVVEHYYSLRDFDGAKRAAETILGYCESDGDTVGAAVAAYGLARCHMRLHRSSSAVHEACNLSIARFLRVAGVSKVGFETTKGVDLFLRWRLGLLYLLKGLARWDSGDLEMGMSRLLIAKWCLLGTGDFIALANVEHSIGTILRSTGDHAQAIEVLERARASYKDANHHLNFARCLTSIGRAQIDLEAFESAKNSLESALVEAEKAANGRQQAETMVWLSWLHRSASAAAAPWASVAIAERYAKLAADVDIPSKAYISSEAAIALGHCRLAQRDVGAAEKCFLLALANAGERFPKLKIHAQLSLAELHCSPGARDYSEATRYFVDAKNGLNRASTWYLAEKHKKVGALIAASESEFWSITTDKLYADGLKRTVEAVKEWALDRVSQEKGSLRSRARKLRLSATGYKIMTLKAKHR
jgi:tetratricopeptide (TPR) repeat protein